MEFALKPHERMFADLTLLGWPKSIVYKTLWNSKAESATINTAAYKYSKKPEIIEYQKVRLNELTSKGISRVPENESIPNKRSNLRTHEDIERELNDILNTPELDATARVNALLKLKDSCLQAKQNNKAENVHYYLPLKCCNCKLYIKEKQNLNDKQHVDQ